jgi:glyoxylase-like metal-dependent hydrolase (beta-lactamase superfamily II)
LPCVAWSKLPPIDRLMLATVTSVPEWYPELATFEPFPVHAWVIRHPDGVVLVDTGIGFGNPAIEEWCNPQVTSLVDALGAVGLATSDIAEGVRLLSTPGHKPGHQSVVIEAADERVVLAAQCAYRAEELRSGQPAASNLFGETWEDAARDSLRRLRALAPFTAQFSHDPENVTVV